LISIEGHLQLIKSKKQGEQVYIWCTVRSKWLVLTPEEVVRQAAISYLVDLGYSIKHITVERQIQVNQLSKRYDIVVSNKSGRPFILVECKQPKESISNSAIAQASIYNLTLTGRYIWLTNGYDHKLFEIDHDNKLAHRIDSLPSPTD